MSATPDVIQADERGRAAVWFDREMEEEVYEEIRARAANEVLCHHGCERCREAGGLDHLAKLVDPSCPIHVTGCEIGSQVPEVLMVLDVKPAAVIDRDDGQHVVHASYYGGNQMG